MNVRKPLITTCCCVLIACTTYKKPLDMPIIESKKIPPVVAGQSGTKFDMTREKGRAIANENLGANTNISSWEISGALVARNQKKSYSASINWLQQGTEHYQIRLIGPLGGGTIIIEKQNGVVRFRDGSKRIESASADQLLLSQTGVRLPVHNLFYWVRGLPAPSGKISARTNNQEISEFHQNGYTISYLEYATGGRQLPTKIRIVGHGVFMKLVIKQWKF